MQHPGKARELSHTIFDEPPKNSGGVRFYAKYEQIFQIANHGIDMIVGDILPVCKKENGSKCQLKK